MRKKKERKNEIIYHTNVSYFSHFLHLYINRHVAFLSYSLSRCAIHAIGQLKKTRQISMIVCDKFDEDFACIVHFRSQIDLFTDEISFNIYRGTRSISLACIHDHPLRKLIEQIKIRFNVVVVVVSNFGRN